ncbi:hypothetical protein A0256_11940 [Mucilaginibacter sp. PAMC 26640]|nr:hypothetical protein A0256_11940 [Mucilaginibacter sp. PAMC 26640]
MKKLLLIRHAKATQESGYSDFERPLTETGIADATTMAQHLKEQGIVPQLFVSSPALRTHTTANIFADTLALPPADINKAIYDAGEPTLVRVINELPDDRDFVAVVGHNPAVAQVLYLLSGQIKEVPPGTVSLIEFELNSWQEIYEDSGKLIYYDNPKL